MEQQDTRAVDCNLASAHHLLDLYLVQMLKFWSVHSLVMLLSLTTSNQTH